jgi:hypothetical protein
MIYAYHTTLRTKKTSLLLSFSSDVRKDTLTCPIDRVVGKRGDKYNGR